MAIKADIHIQALVKKRKTILKSSFASHPFKIMDITEDKRGLELCLMLMSSSPGVLDEDCYNITVELEREAFVRLETQSYQRLFQMKKGASQQVEIRMQEGACFYYL